MKRNILALLTASAMALTGTAALAQSAGDLTVGVGIGYVAPKSNNGLLAGAATSVNDDLRPTLTVEYFIRDNLGIELLAATPFEHTATVSGVGTATTKHLPPTLTLNYHFANSSKVTPFLGAGLNYTTFFQEKSALGTVKMKDSFGLAVHAGFDYAISDNGALRTDVRWMDIDTDVSLNGSAIGTAKIDPVVVGVSYIHKF
ncbi:OmpW/AlkL family protein [Actibacterium sp. XHP0104]|uniref:OmpW/AlkL family protein n=1 Tax=Actibacterium sp. XHP0104 TaxID=2984335 RepID=UPI0021E8558D|nr:OmpW family outer membrane protein [Actibacterium sp. XHP0104]MCV2880673.1 outer membrane beta-barrel protein [Actibacterium sp. XHP0104]